MIKKILATSAMVGLLLVGCGTQPQASAEGNGGFFQEKYHKLPDGRTVLCLYTEYKTGYGAGMAMDCDWDGAIVHTK